MGLKYMHECGRFQFAIAALNKLIPDQGPCPRARGINKALDRYRRAQNNYYDYINNGGMNRLRSIRAMTGYNPNHESVDFMEWILDRMLDDAIRDAVIEQMQNGTLADPAFVDTDGCREESA